MQSGWSAVAESPQAKAAAGDQTVRGLRERTSVASPRPVRVVRTDSLQGVLLLPEPVHTLVPDGGEGALHQLSVC